MGRDDVGANARDTDTTRGSAIRLQDAAMRYAGGYDAVRCVTTTLDAGGRYLWLGRSGSGKTALCKTICGIETLTHGSICVDGTDMRRIRQRDRNMAMTFGDESFAARVSVRKQWQRVLRLHGADATQIEQRIDRIAQAFDLTGAIDTPYGKLNALQRACARVGRCCLRDVGARLLDDPFATLDDAQRADAYAMTAAFGTTDRATWAVATRCAADANAMRWDRIGILERGVLVQQAETLDEMLRAPRHIGVYLATGDVEDAAILRRDAQGWYMETDDGARIPAVAPIDEIYLGATVALACDTKTKQFRPHYFDAASGYRIGAPQKENTI